MLPQAELTLNLIRELLINNPNLCIRHRARAPPPVACLVAIGATDGQPPSGTNPVDKHPHFPRRAANKSIIPLCDSREPTATRRSTPGASTSEGGDAGFAAFATANTSHLPTTVTNPAGMCTSRRCHPTLLMPRPSSTVPASVASIDVTPNAGSPQLSRSLPLRRSTRIRLVATSQRPRLERHRDTPTAPVPTDRSIKSSSLLPRRRHHSQLSTAMPLTSTRAYSRNIANSASAEGPLWQASNADEEIGRLAKGHGAMIKGTNTLFFIPISAIPNDRKATYRRVVSVQCPEKDNFRLIRWTVGGDKFDYPFDISIKTADLTTAKLLFNSVLPTLNAKFLATNLKDF
ncbi:Reverse transcriptase (RNA-dependent DNA polymerase) [Fragilaria crotonensis]|nr:Reverse transcriptase (RNA-dependent DNA polymerase) [Fragilaria crotonensis]